jgi:lysophospholipase L1-like esterase
MASRASVALRPWRRSAQRDQYRGAVPSPRPTPTPRVALRPEEPDAPNYWIRRLGALAVLGVIVYAAVVALTGFLGSDDNAAQSADPAGTDGAGGVASAPATDADARAGTTVPCVEGSGSAQCGEQALVDGGAESAGAAIETTSTTTGPPTPEHPAKVYVVGDSDAGTFGPYLETLLDGTRVADTELNYQVSSGLARPDFFNWPEELAATLPEVDPDIVVVTFGGNDSQGLSLPQAELEFMVGDPVANEEEWTEEYERRAGEVMDLLLENDRAVIWVGIPNDDNPEVTEKLAIQDRAVKAAAAERPDLVFVDTWSRFSGRDGGWAEFVVDPRDKQGKDVRADDGFHLNQTGAEILAIDIAVEVQEVLRELGADL